MSISFETNNGAQSMTSSAPPSGVPMDDPGWPPRDEVTVGVLTALPREGAAMMGLIDGVRDFRNPDDPNLYRVGTLPSGDPDRPHRVALLLLPRDGTRQAATACGELLRTFPGVRCVIVVGVAAGIPRPRQPERHVRLGDVVVATEGIIDYGHLHKAYGAPRQQRHEGLISQWLGRSAWELQLADESGDRPWERWLDPEQTQQALQYPRPADETDVLYVRGFPVEHPDQSRSGHRRGLPKVHYGAVASADILIGDQDLGADLTAGDRPVMAVEIGDSGIAASTAAHDVSWFMVRGIAGYPGTTGNDDRWQRYAAYAAAAYVRALLEVTPPSVNALPLVPMPQQDQLDLLLRRLPPGIDVPAVWNVSAPGPADPPSDVLATPARAYRFLSALNAGGDGLAPALIFIGVLADYVGDAELAAELRRWVASQARAMRAAGALERRLGQPAGVGDQDAGPCLLIAMSVDGIDRAVCQITPFIQDRAGPWRPRPGPGEPYEVPLAEAESVVGTLVDRAELEWRDTANPAAIEFLLHDGLLNLPVEWFRPAAAVQRAMPLCVDYPVVIRSLSRMRQGGRFRAWGSRWSALMGPSAAGNVLWGVHPRNADELVSWEVGLRSDETVAAVVLSGPPNGWPGREEMDIALEAGVPVILWDRRAPRPADTETIIGELLGGTPAEVAVRTRRLRIMAVGAPERDRDSHPGTFVALLWDDPNRLVAARSGDS
jgi:nucleoside phosphorylase